MKNLILFVLLIVSNVAFAQSYNNKDFKDWLVRMGFEGSSDEERIKSLLKQDSLQTFHDLKFLHCKGQEELKAEIKNLIKKEEASRKVYVNKRFKDKDLKDSIRKKKVLEDVKFYKLAKNYLKTQAESCVSVDYDSEEENYGGGSLFTEEEGIF